MNWAVQFIVTPSGERLAVLPEDEYLIPLAASEDDDGRFEQERGVARRHRAPR